VAGAAQHVNTLHKSAPEPGPHPAPGGRLALWLDLIRWDRPAGWLLLLWPTLSALWIAADGWPGWHLLAVFVAGTVLMRSAGCCVNDVADRDFDRHVKRTATRPVTAGLVSVREALTLGAVLALLAFALVLTTNAATVAGSVLALVITLVYPLAKRVVSLPQAVLGLAFSFGIPLAFSAAQAPDAAAGLADAFVQWWQAVPPLAWALLGINALWVLAYDTAYAMVDRDDDLRIGMKTSAITLGRWDVAFVSGCAALHVAAMGALLWSSVGASHNGPARWAWLAALMGAMAQVVWHHRLIRQRSREGCFASFRAHHWLGATLCAGVVVAMSLR
jgi:4-hydroxybenzoate polyprenyltransferase